MNTSFQKQVPKIKNYRTYEHFDNNEFRKELLEELSKYNLHNIVCTEFENAFMRTLNKHAPRKKRYIRANNSHCTNSTLCKAIMVRSKLRNKFLKSKTSESRDKYKRQRNYCVSLLRKIKQSYCEI